MPLRPAWLLEQVSPRFQFPCPSDLVIPYRLARCWVLLRNCRTIFMQLLGLILWVVMRNGKSRALL